jgi:hypothetical protein
VRQDEFAFTGVPGDVFAAVDRALDERTIGHNPERLNLMKVLRARVKGGEGGAYKVGWWRSFGGPQVHQKSSDKSTTQPPTQP